MLHIICSYIHFLSEYWSCQPIEKGIDIQSLRSFRQLMWGKCCEENITTVNWTTIFVQQVQTVKEIMTLANERVVPLFFMCANLFLYLHKSVELWQVFLDPPCMIKTILLSFSLKTDFRPPILFAISRKLSTTRELYQKLTTFSSYSHTCLGMMYDKLKLGVLMFCHPLTSKYLSVYSARKLLLRVKLLVYWIV